MPHPERLEPRTRHVAAIGGAIPERVLRWARAAERERGARIRKLWDEVDVVLMPSQADGPYRAGEFGRWGTAKWIARAGERLPYMPTANLTGQPAAAVPSGFDDDGLPVGVQLVGRPREEATLLSLGAQIETQRPWADRRPSVT
jgi:amidase